MRVNSTFSGQTAPAGIKAAILIYKGPEATAATYNGVALDSEGRAIIGPGNPLTRGDLERLIGAMSAKVPGTSGRALLPENLLFADMDLMMWWVPSHRRPIFFETDNKTLNKDVSGHPVLHPALLFQAKGKELYLWALDESTRPTPETPLRLAPYYNMYSTGHMCTGDYRFPDTLDPNEIPKWERGFFDTHFSHTNGSGGRLTRHPHGHDALWREMMKTPAKNFPAKYLEPARNKTGKADLTLAEVLANGS